ncbi:MAG: hypothetical protein JSR87_11625 [Proteobacteria bacterium]|nr:hypothetical protein [Pseudomonadota bacterium]MBS0574060.1 hypothetical protein [Pseudomonadota bacterium]
MATLLFALPVQADEIVGRTIVNGKDVLLFSDNSWAYENSFGNNCKAVSKAVSFCGEKLGWEKSGTPSPEIAAAYRHDAKLYGQFVVEEFGRNDGSNIEAVKSLVLSGIEEKTGEKPGVLAANADQLDGHPSETLVFVVRFKGLPVVFANTIVLTDTSTVQVQTYRIGETTYSDAHRKLHEEFAANTKLGTN